MRDITFSYAMLVLAGATMGPYGARILFWGRARHARVDTDGGSIFVNKRFMEYGYWLVAPVVTALRRSGVTPDMVTAFCLLPALAAGVAASQGWFGLACVLATVAALGDIIDGLLARLGGMASDAGEAFDAAVDRYGEFALFGGLVFYYRFSTPLCVLSLLALFGAFMVSYSTAKAEALNVPPPRGWMRRAERAIYMLFGCGLTPIASALAGADAPLLLRQAPLILAITLIAVMSNISVISRMRSIVRSIRRRDAERAQIAAPVAGEVSNSGI